MRRLICLALALVTIGVYVQVLGFDFVNYDDPDYVTANKFVKDGLTPSGFVWAFTHFHAGNWHPLTWISHMLDCQLFGLHAEWHHLVSVLFHAANAVLLFLLFDTLTGARWRSAMVAALFALHPLHVESVAWIAERKDVLSTFFGLLSLIAYTHYAHCISSQSPKSKTWFLRAIAFFVLSLLAKPMLVTLPFLMLLLDIWPLKRIQDTCLRSFLSPQFGKLAIEKWPWFVLTAVSCLITVIAQKSGGALASAENFPLRYRLANAIVAYFDYLLKSCWPFHLSVFYPLPHALPAGSVLLAAAVLLIISIVAVASLRRWPVLFVGWFWFLGTLVPVIGLIQVGGQAMADRYTYVPLIGVFLAAVWSIAEGLRRFKISLISLIAGTAALAFFSSVTVYQQKYWRNSLSLFAHALAVTADNAPAHNNMGTALAAVGKREEALAHYQEAVRLDPNNPHYQNNLGTAFLRAGQPAAAVEHYQAALSADPKFAEAYSNLGTLFLSQHRLGEAITNLSEAVRVDPENGLARSNLGNALLAAGRLDDALVQYLEGVRLNPDDATLHLNAGLALLKANRADEAAVQFSIAARLNPASPEAHFEFGRQLFLQGNFPRALEQFDAAVKLKPNYAAAQFYQAATEAESGRFEEATATANQALASAQQAGQTNLATHIQEALEFFKQHRTLTQKPARN